MVKELPKGFGGGGCDGLPGAVGNQEDWGSEEGEVGEGDEGEGGY